MCDCPKPANKPQSTMYLTRRAFVLGAISAPTVARADLINIAEPANGSTVVEQVSRKSVTLLNFKDSNMAGCCWQWDFSLEKAQDGSFTAKAIQYDDFAEEGEEPWELDPVPSLRTGAEVCTALREMVSNAGYYADEGFLDGVSDALDMIDPTLASEFRQEMATLATDNGWDL